MLYVRIAGVMLATALAKVFVYDAVSPEPLHGDIHGVASYLEVLGGLYSITVAFLIYVVWDQFNRVQGGVSREASVLEDLCRIANFLFDRDSATRVRLAARHYMKTTAGDEPAHLAAGTMSVTAHKAFCTLTQAVRAADVKTEKDAVAYQELLSALRRASDARDDRLAVSLTRIPSTLWALVVFGSFLMVLGFLALGILSLPLAIAACAAVSGLIAFLLAVVRDID